MYNEKPVEKPHSHPILAGIVQSEIEALQLTKTTKVLEIGSREGYFARLLWDKTDYVGIDASESRIAELATDLPDAALSQADFLEWETPEGSWDVVLLIDALSSMNQQAEVLEKARKVLKPGGLLVMSVANAYVYERISWWQEIQEGEIRAWLTKRQLHDLVEGAGLEEKKFYTVLPEGDRGFLHWLNAKVFNIPLSKVIPEEKLEAAKERMGFGQFIITIARRPEEEETDS